MEVIGTSHCIELFKYLSILSKPKDKSSAEVFYIKMLRINVNDILFVKKKNN